MKLPVNPVKVLAVSFAFAVVVLSPVRADEAGGLVTVESLAEQKVTATTGSFEGFTRMDFSLPGDGAGCIVVAPAIAAPGTPWIWRARFWGHEPAFDRAMLEHGYHVAYCDVSDLFGAPKAVTRWDLFYQFARKSGLGAKPVLEGMSRGGLIIFNWAKANPEKVTAIYGDNPVCDIRSWPMKRPGKESDRALAEYGLTKESLPDFKGNPIDGLERLAAAQVPVFFVLGARDTDVPMAENADVLEARYKALGGPVRRWVKPEAAHHPHGLAPVQPLVDAVLAAAKASDEGGITPQ